MTSVSTKFLYDPSDYGDYIQPSIARTTILFDAEKLDVLKTLRTEWPVMMVDSTIFSMRRRFGGSKVIWTNQFPLISSRWQDIYIIALCNES